LTGNGTASAAGVFGVFDSNIISGQGTPPLAEPIFLTNAIDVTTTGGTGTHTLAIYVTEQDLTSFVGANLFVSSFTSNTIDGVVSSVLEQTFLDQGNGKFATTIPLGSQTFTAIGTAVETNLSPASLMAPYSMTAEY